MANFKNNAKAPVTSKAFVPTVNHEGTTVHQLTDLETLFSQVLGSFFGESTHYEKKNAADEFKKLYERIQRVSDSDKEYVLKIAELGRLCDMIDYPLNILSVVFNDDRFLGKNFVDAFGKNRVWSYANKIILRSKDIVSIMSAQIAMFDKRSSNCINIDGKKGTALPMQLRKVLRRKFESYDKFKLSKGLSNNSDVTLKDCMRLLRPKPKNKDFEKFYKELREGNVLVGDGKAQIKTESVKKGQTKTQDNTGLVKAVAEDNLQNIVKNLVSLHKQGVFSDKEALSSVCRKLRDPKEVKLSRLLPFRFYSAYKEVSKLGTSLITNNLKSALCDALDLSVGNAEPLEGVTCTLVDYSGSMDKPISEKSVVTAHDVAAVLAAIAYKSGVGDLFVFSDECKKVTISNKAPVMDIVNAISNTIRESGTDLANALRTIDTYSVKTNTRYDSLIMLSDNDCYGYDKNSNKLTFGERGGWRTTSSAPEDHINNMISRGVFRKVWLNNLLGNEFAIFNTASDTKNLITGFNEQFLNMVSVYNMLGGNKDIRLVIDVMLGKLKGKNAPKEKIDPKELVLED